MAENRALNITLVTTALLVGLLLTVLGYYQSRQHYHAEARARFDRQAERLVNEVQRQMQQAVYGLKGARGVYAASKSVERAEFRAYVESRQLAVEFPGVLGFGFIQRVQRSDLEAFIAAERADGAPDFTVRTTGNAPDLYVIKFVEPLGANREAWGFDVGSEAIRRAAVETPRDYPFALSYEGIKAGVQAASAIRAEELMEDFPWVRTTVSALEPRR